MLNYKTIIRTFGILLIGEGIFLLLPLLISLFYREEDYLAFLYSMSITLSTGFIFYLLSEKSAHSITKREGYVLIGSSWIILSLFGSLPYLFSHAVSSFHDAFFEAMSGFTTTGASVITAIESLPHGILLWRSLTQWLGGMGIVILSLAILPAFGIGGLTIFTTEAPGITPDKLNPRIKDTAKLLWNIYLIFTVFETFLLFVGGMNIFDAVCQSFTTISTGGFSTKQAGIGYWSSPYIHYVIVFFMIVAGTNFSLSFLALTGTPKKLFKNEEFKYFLIFIIFFTLLITVGLLLTTNYPVEKAFRNSLFQVVSIITTTGFTTDNYLKWSPFLGIIIFFLFFMGGSTGSTSGGIKITRIVLLVKNSYYELRRLIHPNAVIPLRFNKRTVNNQVIANVLAFFFFYVTTFFVSSLIFMFFVDHFETSFGAIASCLGNIGPGFGTVGPGSTFSHIAPLGKWFLTFVMLMGRLELFTLVVMISPSFWKR